MVHQVSEYYGNQAEEGPSILTKGIQAFGRLIFPVIALLAVFLWADMGSSQTVTWFDAYFDVEEIYLKPSYWMTSGHLVLPFIYFTILLTNRRYGPAYATAQVTAVWLTLAVMIYWFFFASDDPMATRPLPPVRTCVVFVVALALSQFISISIFDQTRGNPWWRAPLYAPIWGALAFCLMFYPGAYWGEGQPWVNQMVTHFGFMTAISFLLVFPYYLLRPIIRPLPGFGGA